MSTKQKIIIIDGNALVHRAFHALPPTMQTKDGVMTNAAYGFVMILFKVLKELKPQYGILTFDAAKKTFRHEQYKEYKANRVKQPDELYAQFPIVKEIVRAFNIPIYEQPGFEADDLIGTLTKKIDDNLDKYIVTGDMDTLQLITEHTKVFTMKKGVKDTIIYDRAAVQSRFSGLTPEQMIDYKALRGDPSDNIPGVKGIGEKGAIELLTKYKTLDGIYKNIDQIKGALKDKLSTNKADAYLSQKLATIICDIPLKIKLGDCLLTNYQTSAVVEVLQKYEFKSLLAQLQSVPQLKPQQSLFAANNESANISAGQTINNNYQLVDTQEKVQSLVKKLSKQKIFALDTETTSLNFIDCRLVGMSFCWQDNHAYFVIAKFANKLKNILEDPKIKKIGHNIKYDLHALHNAGINLQGIFADTMLMSYLLNPGTRQHSLDKLAFSELGHQMITYEDLCGKGAKQVPITTIPLDRLTQYAAEDADYTWRLYEKLDQEIKKNKLEKLLTTLETPLIPVLAKMERFGVEIDKKFLSVLHQKLNLRLKKLELQIHQLAGAEFNIASPLQLKEILFTKLKISSDTIKKGKTGLSTAAAELEKMRGAHPIIPLIEEYRELSKLLNTYIDALPELINKTTDRVHTSFNQTITATGRLSSSDPNLQNIPIRTELGKELRKAFVAPKGYQIVALDYSQIELRIIAHLAQDQKMLAAFNADADIHQKTADEIGGITRRQAKAINFGVIYGMGAYGLAQDAGISRGEARDFLDRYLALYQDVAKYVESAKQSARDLGYAETLFGRRRYLTDIHSQIFNLRLAAERMAINMPAQGTAADLIKIAMLEVDQQIQDKKIKAKMILQVHDELVFEIKDELAKTEAIKIQKIMEQVYPLDCPLKVDIGIGKNWGETK